MISNIAKITVYVNNSAEAKKFWTENMGFVIREEQLMGSGMTWLETAPDYHAQTTIVLFERSRMEKSQSAGIYSTSVCYVYLCGH